MYGIGLGILSYGLGEKIFGIIYMTTTITGKFSPTETTENHNNYQKYDFTATKNGNNYSMTINMNKNKVLGTTYSFKNNNRNINETKESISFNITEKEFSRLKQPDDGFHVFSKKKDFKKVSLDPPCPGKFRAESVQQTGGTKRKTNKRTKRKNARKSRKQRI